MELRLEVEGAPLAEGLEPLRWQAREALNAPFALTVVLRPRATLPPGRMRPETLVGCRARFSAGGSLAGGGRSFAGVVERAMVSRAEGEGPIYTVQVRPDLWRLGLGRGCRIFAERGVPELVTALAGEVAVPVVATALTGEYRPRGQRVQYRESSLAFLGRVCEEAGITFVCQSTAEGEELVLYDGAFPAIDGERTLGLVEGGLAREATAGEARVTGRSTSLRLGPGVRFEVAGPAGGQFLAIAVEHEGRAAHERAPAEEPAGPLYRNRFVAVPAALPYRPAKLAPAPRITGLQTALVVGPRGAEIHTDSLGRIQVRFPWDRDAPGPGAWIPVAQRWAGAGLGGLFLPRVGHEVLVAFQDGDPERPVVVGSVYAEINLPPALLPDEQTRTALRSAGALGGTGFCEWSFEDRAGAERVFLHAGRDQSVRVGHDARRAVAADEAVRVAAARAVKVGGPRAIFVGAGEAVVKGGQTLVVQGGQALAVTGPQSLSTGGGLRRTIAGDSSVTIAAGRTRSIGGDDVLEVGGDGTVTVGGADRHEVGGDASRRTSGTATVEVGGDHREEARARSLAIAGASRRAFASDRVEQAGTAEVRAERVQKSAGTLARLEAGTLLLEPSHRLVLQVGGRPVLTMTGDGTVELLGQQITVDAETHAEKGKRVVKTQPGAVVAAAAPEPPPSEPVGASAAIGPGEEDGMAEKPGFGELARRRRSPDSEPEPVAPEADPGE